MAEPDVPDSTNCATRRPSRPRLSGRDLVQLFAVSAFALLVSFLGQLMLAAVLTALPLRMFVIVLIRTSAWQDLVVLLWAALSGALFLLGVGRLAWISRARFIALVAGAISPWVLLGLAQLEGHFWPAFRETTGPLDRPLMTLPLLVCVLFTPWLAGRVARVGAPGGGTSAIEPNAVEASERSSGSACLPANGRK